MLPTHALAGVAIATPLALSTPELAPAALGGGLVGGVLTDLDMYAGHRRSLHFPTLYLVLAVPATLAAAALHCRMDVYGGGLELRPWEGTSERAVYDHVRGEWRSPRRLVAYDGSPGDLALSVAVGLPLLVVLEGVFAAVVAVGLVVAVAYAVLRRPLANLAPAVFELVPDRFAAYVPERYQSE